MNNTQKVVRFLTCCSLLTAAALLAGCASNKAETRAESKSQEPAKTKTSYKDRQYAANPSKLKFGEFKCVELKETEIAPQHSNNKANQQSARKIDEMLLEGLKSVFLNIKVISGDAGFSKTTERTLQISPSIEDIRLVSVGARVWFGVMAGGSDIVMKVTYRDSSTGEIIADPDFWKSNNAWSGGWSMGATDNQIRDAVVAQIVGYTSANK